jgi:hypothetical protein
MSTFIIDDADWNTLHRSLSPGWKMIGMDPSKRPRRQFSSGRWEDAPAVTGEPLPCRPQYTLGVGPMEMTQSTAPHIG